MANLAALLGTIGGRKIISSFLSHVVRTWAAGFEFLEIGRLAKPFRHARAVQRTPIMALGIVIQMHYVVLERICSWSQPVSFKPALIRR